MAALDQCGHGCTAPLRGAFKFPKDSRLRTSRYTALRLCNTYFGDRPDQETGLELAICTTIRRLPIMISIALLRHSNVQLSGYSSVVDFLPSDG